MTIIQQIAGIFGMFFPLLFFLVTIQALFVIEYSSMLKKWLVLVAIPPTLLISAYGILFVVSKIIDLGMGAAIPMLLIILYVFFVMIVYPAVAMKDFYVYLHDKKKTTSDILKN